MSAKPEFALTGVEDEANVMDELLRMSKAARADSRRLAADADKFDAIRLCLLEKFRAQLKRKRSRK